MQDLENKGDNLQDLQNAGVMASLELLETQACGWWILFIPNSIERPRVKWRGLGTSADHSYFSLVSHGSRFGLAAGGGAGGKIALLFSCACKILITKTVACKILHPLMLSAKYSIQRSYGLILRGGDL